MAAEFPALDKERGVMTMAPLLAKVTPAVVNISVKTRVPADENPLMRDPFFRRFFDVPDQRPPREAISAGSGVIVGAAKGYVLTNHHVVDNAHEITVTLVGQRRLKAKLIGSDPGTDIALLSIKPVNLAQLPIGNSDRLKVGDIVVAIGNPFGLGQTVTSGIISALGRTGIAAEKYEDFIQTDASINPGNSGGALVNSKGELIGINTAIIAPGGGNVGIGFAVPSNMARQVMDQLIRFGEVRRGRIGITIQDLTPGLAAALDLEGKRGAVVSSVQKASPAEKAGLRSGDVIVQVDGKPVANSSDLRNRIGLMVRGTNVTIGYFRSGKMMTARVTIGAMQDAALKGDDAIPLLAGALITEIQEDHPAKGNVEGVLVASLAQGSRAWRNGLRQGDIILAVNQQRVRSLSDFKKAASREETLLALNIVRGDAQLFMVMR
jgi:Do/DeqQ family serine protease